MRTSERRLKNKLEHLPRPFLFTGVQKLVHAMVKYCKRDGFLQSLEINPDVHTQRKEFPAKGRRDIRDKRTSMSSVGMHSPLTMEEHTPPWGFSLQALIIDKSCPHLNYTVHSSLWGKKDSAEIKSIIPRKGIILSSEDTYMEEQSWWAVLWSFWLKCCLRILLFSSNMKQSIRLWYIHVIKTCSYKICQSKTSNTFALKSPY